MNNLFHSPELEQTGEKKPMASKESTLDRTLHEVLSTLKRAVTIPPEHAVGVETAAKALADVKAYLQEASIPCSSSPNETVMIGGGHFKVAQMADPRLWVREKSHGFAFMYLYRFPSHIKCVIVTVADGQDASWLCKAVFWGAVPELKNTRFEILPLTTYYDLPGPPVAFDNEPRVKAARDKMAALAEEHERECCDYLDQVSRLDTEVAKLKKRAPVATNAPLFRSQTRASRPNEKPYRRGANYVTLSAILGLLAGLILGVLLS